MLRCGLLACLLLAQEPDLVEQLGDPDIGVRERAAAALAAQGSAAREKLTAARKHADPEVRSRAYDLLCRFDPDLALERLKNSQRWLHMTLVAGRSGTPADAADVDGARFRFSRRPWAPKGEVLGTIVETGLEPSLRGQVLWSLVSVDGDAPLAVETCALHSPGRVYIPGPAPGKIVVRLKGTRHWRCEVPVEFKNPQDGDQKTVGGYTLTLKWPELRVASERPVLQTELSASVDASEIRGELRPGREPRRFGGRVTLVATAACGGDERPNPAWCGCEEKPYPGARQAPATMTEFHVHAGLMGASFDDYSSVTLPFHLPVEEPFEVTSPPLK